MKKLAVLICALIAVSSVSIAQGRDVSNGLKIDLLKNGKISLDGEISDIQGLTSRLKRDQAEGRDDPVRVFNAEAVSNERLMQVLNLLKRYERVKIGLVTGKAS